MEPDMPTAGYISLIAIATAAAGAILVLSLVVTNPTSLGATGVTIWFIDLFATTAGVITLALQLIKTYLHLHSTGITRLRYSWRQGLLLSGWVTLVLALSSLGQLAVKDAVLIGVILVLFEVYMRLQQS